MDYHEKISLLSKEKMPRHIAIIMDGNGRWAKQRGKNRLFGHQAGVKSVRAVIEAGVEIELECMTLYAFSTENWNRPKTEVQALLKMIQNYLVKEIKELSDNNVIVNFIGSKKHISESYREKIHKTCQMSWTNTGMRLNIAMNYGGRIEITEAVQQIAEDIEKGKIKRDDISESLISSYLYTAQYPDPDLIIRTSGEYRLSNYLIWQSAYSEFWFTDTLWPDFGKDEFLDAVLDYQNRQRRFGKV
ncbi:MAG: isoprenyl transferase [Candidatus Cloacimonetes bacterium]|nr:isoprenyl transferase [Candidatus Cloacimonadota bacterium]